MSTDVRPVRLWRTLPLDVRTSAALAFWRDEDAGVEQAEAVALLARHLHFRPKSILALPAERKARLLAGLVQVPDLVALRLLVAYHLDQQRPMMAAFLDAVGIAHDNGLITEEEPKPPAPETLDEAVAVLAKQYPSLDVARYLWTLLWQDQDTWGGLEGRRELVLG